MLNRLIAGVLGAVALSAAWATEPAPLAPKEPVKLTDAELDQVTAGGVLAVIIVTPGKGSHTMNEHNRSIIIIGGGRGTPPSHTIIKTP